MNRWVSERDQTYDTAAQKSFHQHSALLERVASVPGKRTLILARALHNLSTAYYGRISDKYYLDLSGVFKGSTFERSLPPREDAISRRRTENAPLLLIQCSSISANLKGSAAEDRPLHKREHHLRHRIEDGESDTGVSMIIPEGEIGAVAPPDVVTTDLEAYIKGIINSREKDWDVIGARRVAVLWNGSLAEQAGVRPQRRMDRGLLGRKMVSRELESLEEGEDNHMAHGAKGAFERVTARTGQALKGGFGLVSSVCSPLLRLELIDLDAVGPQMRRPIRTMEGPV